MSGPISDSEGFGVVHDPEGARLLKRIRYLEESVNSLTIRLDAESRHVANLVDGQNQLFRRVHELEAAHRAAAGESVNRQREMAEAGQQVIMGSKRLADFANSLETRIIAIERSLWPPVADEQAAPDDCAQTIKFESGDTAR